MWLYNSLKWHLQDHIKGWVGRVDDILLDRAASPKLARFRQSGFYKTLPALRVLVVGVQSSRRPGSLEAIYCQMQSARHQVTFDSKNVEEMSKLDNINALLSRHNLDDYDWVIMVDDDVALPAEFTDMLLALAEYADLKICGAAQRAHSYWSFPVTKRQKGALVRETNFAEVGPIVAFRREVFHLVFPFPSLKYGWGVDLVWPVLAEKEGWKTGIADGAALRHLHPIGGTYDFDEASKEAETYMNRFGIYTGVHETRTISVIQDIA